VNKEVVEQGSVVISLKEFDGMRKKIKGLRKILDDGKIKIETVRGYQDTQIQYSGKDKLIKEILDLNHNMNVENERIVEENETLIQRQEEKDKSALTATIEGMFNGTFKWITLLSFVFVPVFLVFGSQGISPHWLWFSGFFALIGFFIFALIIWK
jgi:hypothetical protein